MRIEQLRYLEAAVRMGSLRRAASTVGVSQPTLTQQIRKLEEELNVTLLRRAATGVAATSSAIELMPFIRGVLRAESGVRQTAEGLSALNSGEVKMGVIPAAGRGFVPPLIRQFQATHPAIRFQIMESGSATIRAGVESGELDLGIVSNWHGDALGGHENNTNLLTTVVYESEIALAVPRDHRLADRERVELPDLVDERFIVVQEGHVLRRAFDLLAAEVSVLPIYFTSGSDAALALVSGGVGVTLFGASRSEEWRADTRPDLRLIEIEAPWTATQVVLIRRQGELPTPAMRELMRMIRGR